jgi:AcrR family transcriptional regulator
MTADFLPYPMEFPARTATRIEELEGRHALLVAMLRHAHQRAGARMPKAAAREGRPAERLWAVIQEALPLDAERLAEWRVWLAFWGAAAGNPGLLDEHEQRYSEWRALLEALAREAAARGAGAEGLTDALIGLIDGYGVQIALCKSPKAARARELRASGEAALRAQLGMFGARF